VADENKVPEGSSGGAVGQCLSAIEKQRCFRVYSGSRNWQYSIFVSSLRNYPTCTCEIRMVELLACFSAVAA
jgi:hypothetical protein